LVEELEALARSVISLFIIVDPLGNVPIFLSLTAGFGAQRRNHVFTTAVVTGFMLLFSFALLGNEILRLFSISLSSFKIAGGLLLLALSLRMLIFGSWAEVGASPASLGAVPLGFPLLAGPGAITATIVSLQSAGLLLTTLSILIVSMITWIVLRLIDRIHRLLGEAGSTVVSRVLAVLIAAIAVEFMLNGLQAYVR